MRLCAGAVAFAVASCASPGEPTHSTFCVLVGKDWKALDGVIAEMDNYARVHALKRGKPSPNGIIYAEHDKRFIIDVSPVGPQGVEVAFFPRIPGTFKEDAALLENFVVQTVASRFPTVRCDDVAGYGKGTIYGYDRIAI